MGAALVGVLAGQLNAELALHALGGQYVGAAPTIADELNEVVPAPTHISFDEPLHFIAL